MLFRWKRGRNSTVEAETQYVGDAGVEPRVDATDPSKSVLSLAPYRVVFHDVRNAAEEPSLDREGFALLPHRTAVTDFADLAQHAVYRAEVEQLVRKVTGAAQVFVAPMIVLRSKSHAPYGEGITTDAVADVVHSDRTRRSLEMEALWAVQDHGLETLPAGRLVSYNVWRALTPPPQDYPLALCDLRTMREEDLVRAVSIGNPANRGYEMEFFLSRYARRHRWCYFSGLTRDEVVMFRQFDTAAAGPPGCLHTAFRHPLHQTAPETRLSAEARVYVFFSS